MDTSWWRILIPYMYNWRGKINMSHSYSPFSRRSNFYSTSFTNNSLISYSLIFSTTTLEILYWSKDWLTEKSALFRLPCSIVYGIRIVYYSMRPLCNIFHWSKRHHQSVKFCFIHYRRFIKAKIFLNL